MSKKRLALTLTGFALFEVSLNLQVTLSEDIITQLIIAKCQSKEEGREKEGKAFFSFTIAQYNLSFYFVLSKPIIELFNQWLFVDFLPKRTQHHLWPINDKILIYDRLKNSARHLNAKCDRILRET